MSKVFSPYLCFDLAGKQLCFPPGKSINRRNENTEDSWFFIFSASNLLTIFIQYCKNFLDRIIWSLLNSNCFSCLNSLNKVLLFGNYFFPRQKMTTRNKRKLAALNKEICEENPRSNMAQNSGAPRSQEDYITQVSEEIEGRVTKRLSKEFSWTENRILGALARLDDFLMNPLLPGHSGTTPEPTRNTSHNKQGTNEDGSQNDPHPEAGLFHGQTTRNVSLEEDHDLRRNEFLGNASNFSFPISLFRRLNATSCASVQLRCRLFF